MRYARHYAPILTALIAALASSSTLLAAEPPDTTDWTCEFCPADTGTTASVTLGVDYLDTDGDAFTDFRGQKDGLNGRISGWLRQRYNDDGYMDLLLEDFGIGTGRMRLVHGTRGVWGMDMRYRVIPHRTGYDAMTPFTGGRNQQLPQSWAPGATTGLMSGLTAALHPVSLGTDRRRFELAFDLPLSRRWNVDASFQRDDVRGRRALGANIATTISQLAAPIDRRTDQWQLGSSWQGDGYMASINYRVSRYTDDIGAITWENPFISGFGTLQGRLASTPDNEFQMLTGDFRYDLPGRTRVSLSYGVGSGEQRTPYIPATINPGLTVAALPATSLRGDVDVTRWDLRVTSRPWRGVGLRFSHHRDDRDNRSPVDLYPEVTTDAFVGGLVANVPYDFRRERTELAAEVRLARIMRLELSASNRKNHRSMQEVLETDEDQLSASLRMQVGSRVTLLAAFDNIDRTGSDYNVIPGITDAQNPRLRKYYMADLNRTRSRFRVDVQVRDDMMLGLAADFSDDTYPDTEIGLLDASTKDLTADFTWSPGERLSVTAYAADQRIESSQAGSSAFTTADWLATDRDDVRVLGATLAYQLDGPWTLAGSFDLSRYDGRTDVSAGASTPVFPDLRSDLTRVNLSLAHRSEGSAAYRFGVLWERLETDDWALDGVSYATLPGMVALGLTSPTYDAVMVYAELDYGF